MVELRWAVPAETTTKAPRLQYRQCSPIVQIGGPSGWSDWQDVPWVVVPQEPPKPAPTALSALGVTASEPVGYVDPQRLRNLQQGKELSITLVAKSEADLREGGDVPVYARGVAIPLNPQPKDPK